MAHIDVSNIEYFILGLHNLFSSFAIDVEKTRLYLTNQAIIQLEQQGNSSDDWSHVFIDPDSIISIRGCRFSPSGGKIIVEEQRSDTGLCFNELSMPCGLLNCGFYGSCYIGDNCAISNTSCLSNVIIGRSTAIVGCGQIKGYNCSYPGDNFGNFNQISVGSESGGRNVVLSIFASFYDICRSVYNHQTDNPIEPAKIASPYTVIRPHCRILYCLSIDSSYIDEWTYISNSTISYSTIVTTPTSKVRIMNGVDLRGGLVHPGCVLENGCYVENTLMYEHSSISTHARVCDSILGPDASIAGGECHRCLVGPFIGFHHHSLLIASLWPLGRGNIGYGAKVGANHTGRVNDQECWPGEGCFFGLGCSIKFPVNLVDSPYSIIAPDTSLSPQLIRLPFSLITAMTPVLLESAADVLGRRGALPVDCAVVKPAWVLHGNPYMIDRWAPDYALFYIAQPSLNYCIFFYICIQYVYCPYNRAAMKFATRRRSLLINTSFPAIRPSLIRKMVDARDRLLIAAASYPHVFTDVTPARPPSSSDEPNSFLSPKRYKYNKPNNPPTTASDTSSIFSTTPSPLKGSYEVYLTEKEVPGLGRCVVSAGDVCKAIDSYNMHIRRYALHVRFLSYIALCVAYGIFCISVMCVFLHVFRACSIH